MTSSPSKEYNEHGLQNLLGNLLSYLGHTFYEIVGTSCCRIRCLSLNVPRSMDTILLIRYTQQRIRRKKKFIPAGIGIIQNLTIFFHGQYTTIFYLRSRHKVDELNLWLFASVKFSFIIIRMICTTTLQETVENLLNNFEVLGMSSEESLSDIDKSFLSESVFIACLFNERYQVIWNGITILIKIVLIIFIFVNIFPEVIFLCTFLFF